MLLGPTVKLYKQAIYRQFDEVKLYSMHVWASDNTVLFYVNWFSPVIQKYLSFQVIATLLPQLRKTATFLVTWARGAL